MASIQKASVGEGGDSNRRDPVVEGWQERALVEASRIEGNLGGKLETLCNGNSQEPIRVSLAKTSNERYEA